MRPRLLPDTHLLPSDRGVVISGPRHTAAFAVPGMYPWLERLRPFLDGGSSLDRLTADLPSQAARQVRALVDMLAREGFVRDATGDLPHGLSPRVRERHAALIDFVAARADSPEHRFERYRGCAPVVVGSGRVAGALVLALLASGVAHVRLHLADEAGRSAEPTTDTARLHECVASLEAEGGCFRFEQLNGPLRELPSDTGVLLLGSDVLAPEPAARARALAGRAGVPYGQATGRGQHIVISAVDDPGAPKTRGAGHGASRSPAPGGPPDNGFGSGPEATGSTGGSGGRTPSPYLGGPVAALAADRLCLHLLYRMAGLDGSDGGRPSPASGPTVLDLLTGRFDDADAV
ncbi:hypothetical protein [Streptomyces sp. NPDC056160]|uniref:hypothetical protein n=1 Tax=Streptomyces sp. NPDC056160 TaxID=3345731 RepID=UPI0035D99F75